MIKTVNPRGGISGELFAPRPDSFGSTRNRKSILLEISKKRRWIFMFIDATLIWSIFLISSLLGYGDTLQQLFPVTDQPYYEIHGVLNLVNLWLLVSVIWTLLMARDCLNSRDLIAIASPGIKIQNIIRVGLKSLVIVMGALLLWTNSLTLVFVYGFAFGLGLLGLILFRIVGQILTDRILQSRLPTQKTLFVGSDPSLINFASILEQNSNGSGQILGFLQFPNEKSLAITKEIEAIRNKEGLDCIVISYADFLVPKDPPRSLVLIQILNYSEAHEIPLYLIPFPKDILVLPSEMTCFEGVPLFLLRDSSQQPGYSIVKRMMDITLSSIFMILGAPLWLMIALAIKLTSEGPCLYVQERAGMNGKPFRMLKFRSMTEDADEKLNEIINFSSLTEPVFNIRKDPRVTKVGAILRRTSLDEIPQFINVLFGDMSLVGPRPERTELVGMYNDYQRRRLKTKPGITGYQQVMSRGDPSLAKRIEYDLFALKHQSLWLDLMIMFKTPLVVIRGDGLETE
jgi:exopolysaccharide biosynthesis polyprenyl glycosylphosphotransferase